MTACRGEGLVVHPDEERHAPRRHGEDEPAEGGQVARTRGEPDDSTGSRDAAYGDAMKRSTRVWVVAAALLAGGTAVVPAHGLCVRMSAAEQFARAQVVFDGVALVGPTATGIQRFRVTRYRKDRGPEIVRVETGYVRRAGGSGPVSSVSIVVERGERWRIFARGNPQDVLRTTICDGSRKL
jgi:hypothetical protein